MYQFKNWITAAPNHMVLGSLKVKLLKLEEVQCVPDMVFQTKVLQKFPASCEFCILLQYSDTIKH